MDYATKFKKQVAVRIFIGVLSPLFAAGLFLFLADSYGIPLDITLFLIGALSTISVIISTVILTSVSTKTVVKLQDIISYAAHSDRSGGAPDIDSLKLGRELVTAQSLQIYDLASTQPIANTVRLTQSSTEAHSSTDSLASRPGSNSLLDSIGVPLIGISPEQAVTVINKAALDYLGKTIEQASGKPIFDVLALSFQEDITLENWISQSKESSVTATRTWERVKHSAETDNVKLLDMVASFSSGHASGTETMLAIFDRTKRYDKDNKEVSFVALAVHELRTPLTVLRGYIEVFEDELGPTLSPELADFMHKMHASAQQLTAFVGNVLNVARIEEDQLSLKLRKEDLKDILQTAVADLDLRARVHGKHIELQIDESIPAIGADRVSIHEVLNNLVDNAIKYSGNAEKILITARANEQGMVETSIQDFGIGIPSAVMPQLFQKFHRSHKSRVQIGGTGLGLYLCKALISAHGGNIWVRSKEGEGSVFSFTLLPFANISAEQVDGEDGIIRGAHGWIKNHSLYRN